MGSRFINYGVLNPYATDKPMGKAAQMIIGEWLRLLSIPIETKVEYRESWFWANKNVYTAGGDHELRHLHD